jgi:hypothetical protein
MFAIPNDFINRFKELQEGEVVTGNPGTTSRTLYDADGNAVVFSAANAALAGETVYIGTNDGSVDILTEISTALGEISAALQNVSASLNDISTVATYPTSVGPTGTMLPPAAASIATAKGNIDASQANIDTVKSNIDGIIGAAPNVD